MPDSHLPEFLSLLDVQRVIVVDDQFMPPPALYTLNYEPENGPSLPNLPPLPEDTDFEDHVAAHWADVPVNAKLDLQREAKKQDGYIDPIGDPTGIKQLIGDRPFFGMTLHEWTDKRDGLLRGGQRALILFDVNFKDETGDAEGEEGLEPAGYAVRATDRHIVGLLTTKTTRGGEEASAGAWASRADVAKADLVVINKTLLAEPDNHDDIALAVQQIRTALQASQLRVLRGTVRDSLQAAIDAAADRLGDRSASVLEDLVFKASREGGEWEGDTWFRLYETLGLDRARRAVATDSRARRAITDVRNLIHVRNEPPSDASAALASEVQDAESYESGEYLNAAGLPIANGDIFETNTGTKFVLVGQPCDLSLRPTGRSRDPDTATLLPIKRQGEDDDAEHSAYVLPKGAILGEERWEVRFRPEHHVAFNVLDLVSFNSEGVASLKPPRGKALTPLLPGLQARHDAITRAAERLLPSLEAVDKMQAEKHITKDVADGLRRAILNGSGPFKATLTARPAPYAFHCRRIARLSGSYADALLATHASARSRTAHAHELTRIVADTIV